MPSIVVLPSTQVADYDHLSIAALCDKFADLCVRDLDDKSIELEKLIIIRRVESLLKTRLNRPVKRLTDVSQNDPVYQQTLVQLAYRFFLLFGFFEKAAGSFLFGSNLFVLIPGITHPSLFVLTGIYTLLDGLLFYAFEVSFLKKILGIPYSESDACVLNDIYMQQLTAVIKINQMVDHRLTFAWPRQDYEPYCKFRQLCNAHLVGKQNAMGLYPRSRYKMALEYGVMIFGALSSIADSYFMAKTALLMLHLSFATSPVGWALVVCMVLSSLVFYYGMGMKSMSKMMNPDKKSFHALKTGLTLFKDEYEHTKTYFLDDVPLLEAAI